MPAHLALHIEHMLYSRAMTTVKKKVSTPELLFLLTLIRKNGGSSVQQQAGGCQQGTRFEVRIGPWPVYWHYADNRRN